MTKAKSQKAKASEPQLGSDEHTLARRIATLPAAQQEAFLKRLPPAAVPRLKELLTAYATSQHQEGAHIELLPHQQIPEPQDIEDGHVFAGGRGAGKTLALANYIARQAERVPGLRARIISPTLSDAVNGVALDPYSGILAQSPSAQFKAHGVEGARVLWPNGSVCFMVGTPTHKDVDRLRALTNIDIDGFDEAAANPRIAEAAQQAALSRRGKRLPHPIWVAATTPRSVPTYKAWLENPRITVTRARTVDNPHTPQEYRDYAESLKGTHLYRQEILGETVDDTPGALWKRQHVDDSMVIDPNERSAILKAVSRVVVGVDPPSGHGTCGIVVVGVTSRELDPTGQPRIVALDDFSISDASPMQWGQRAVLASKTYGAHIVAERNQGGLMVESTIRQAADPAEQDMITVTLATAMVSKERRAAPIALLWEVDPQRAIMAPPGGDLKRFALLVDQMTSWTPGTFSPDRIDAMVWAATYLLQGGQAGSVTLQPAKPRQITTANRFRNALMGRTLTRR